MRKNMNAINRLLRCSRTGRYFTGEGWTQHKAKATHYPDQMQAIRDCLTHRLEDVELVVLDPDANEVFSSRIR